MRHKVFAVINFVVGSFALLMQSILLIVVYPRLTQLYKDMEVQVPFSTRYYPALSIVFIAFLVYVILVAIKLLKSKNPSDSLYKLNVVFTVILLVGSSLLITFSVLSLINPIYGLTNSL